jgi:F420-nonreducing hydrogenase I large subunit
MEIILDPISRVEGHMRVLLKTEKGIVKEAKCSSTLLRGLEKVLVNQEPRKAACSTTRICGFCPTSHAFAGAGALDQLHGVDFLLPDAQLAKNIIQGFDFISNHITHLYMLWFPDLVNPAYSDVIEKKLWDELILRFAPPAYRIHTQHIPPGKSYLKALHARKMGQEAIRELAGNEVRPFPGGLDFKSTENCVTVLKETQRKVMEGLSSMLGIPWREWIENTYLSNPEGAVKYLLDLDKKDFSRMGDFELFAIIGAELTGRDDNLMLDKFGCHDEYFLSCGAFNEKGKMIFRQGLMSSDLEYMPFDIEKITENCTSSFYSGNENHPFEGKTEPLPANEIAYGEKYTWVKAPRYDGKVCEVGSLARLLIAEEPLITGLAKEFKKRRLPVASVYMRLIARIQEMLVAGYLLEGWINDFDPKGIFRVQPEKLINTRGFGLWEAPRGALGHWIELKGDIVSNYQIITPTTWNVSPGGVMEKSLEGSPICAIGNKFGIDCSNPVIALHIVRSFDPCNGCAVHVLDPSGTYQIQVC